ncbi:hypothetical protein [Leptolyngbya sp. FACHB-711]|uniref:hypothetical protein n=1 Tax=unclassified Leptolyngbya TaxID=2650499 RepID=UPI0016821300|nr:hypothetical protein [Leptolyngbya sp. FACHB-711]MBD1849663.1 hypothetical protein [Cyanobacteria bacterium FACHB-502]MBD2028003.1 hypothetical protein [Leptolyngbya sp. FACHB-711]
MNSSNSKAMSLEACIRQALEQGELTPGLEIRIEQIVEQGNLTERDRQLLQLLQDAIQDDCIRRA